MVLKMRKKDNFYINCSPQILFGLGIIMIIMASLAFLSNHQGFGVKIIFYTFIFFFVGLILYLLELKNEND